jgi:hypothetical protein
MRLQQQPGGHHDGKKRKRVAEERGVFLLGWLVLEDRVG